LIDIQRVQQLESSSCSFFTSSSIKPRAHVLLTTYEACIRDLSLLQRLRFSVLCVDEAQRLKNHASKLVHSLCLLRARFRLLLTGTPLQNNLQELWSLLHFVLPQVFASAKDFDQWFQQPLMNDENGDNCEDDDVDNQLEQISSSSLASAASRNNIASGDMHLSTNTSSNNQQQHQIQGNSNSSQSSMRMTILDRLHRLLRPFMLRRTLADVPELRLPSLRHVRWAVPLAATATGPAATAELTMVSHQTDRRRNDHEIDDGDGVNRKTRVMSSTSCASSSNGWTQRSVYKYLLEHSPELEQGLF
jgi:SNF2 family DNA or RNA helicase